MSRKMPFVPIIACFSIAALCLAWLVHHPVPVSAGNDPGIHKIKHIVIIMQENRSFDSYFGTYPGAEGIPNNVCVPNPQTSACVKPYHDGNDRNRGGPHGDVDAVRDVNGGKMDGFIAEAQQGKRGCVDANNPACSRAGAGVDSVGYHDGHELQNYWRYAQNFVLQDRMFEPNASWSLPQHLFMVSEWSAQCSRIGDPSSCLNALQNPDRPRNSGRRKRRGVRMRQNVEPGRPDYAWTDLTYLLHRNHVSWAYYVMGGSEPDCANDAMDCVPRKQSARTQPRRLRQVH